MKDKIFEIMSPIWVFLTKYISVSYLLSVPMGTIFHKVIIPTAILFIIFGIALKYAAPKKYLHLKEKVYKRYVNYFFRWFCFLGFLGLFLAFFSWEQMPYFGYRIWLYFWILGVLAWIIYSAVVVRKKMTKDIAGHKKKKEKEKWMKK